MQRPDYPEQLGDLTRFQPNPGRAQSYAIAQHGAQLYEDEVPYSEHLRRVVDVLNKFGFSENTIVCAGWLHDVLEDTSTSYSDVKKRFGHDVAELVFAVTSELGRNRDEKNAKTYPKIAGNVLATALKLADRIANMEYGIAWGGGMVEKYRREYAAFRGALRAPIMSETILAHLDDNPNHARAYRMWDHLDLLMKWSG